jgi:hypothetical protein
MLMILLNDNLIITMLGEHFAFSLAVNLKPNIVLIPQVCICRN